MKLGAIGECMLEISNTQTIDTNSNTMRASIGFGGDTLNTLIYASRLGVECFYYSALGFDPYSDWLLNTWQSEKINTRFVQRIENKLPGIYAIQLDPEGERQFLYWRNESAAREYLKHIDEDVLLGQLAHLDIVYLSGITLGVFDDPQRERLLSIIRRLKLSGKIIAFDGNYRPRNWESAGQAQSWITRLLRYVDWYLPTLDDEKMLFDVGSIQDVIELHQSHSISDLVIKDGSNGCWIVKDNKAVHVPIPQSVDSIDTTAAGDSFNAGYLAARLHGMVASEAAIVGHKTAAQVIQYHGAIVPIADFKAVKFN
jgi:2-dehydro-3-deoxygluconokinase